MRVTVVGTGYVGLVAGACFSDSGNQVTCLDVLESKVEALRRGEIPIYEPGLESLVERNSREGRLKFTTHYDEAIAGAEVIFLAVGTPPLPNGEPDLQYLKAASESVARHLTGPAVIVNKSTVPIGSHRVVADWMEPHTKQDFSVVSNPEFLKEGSAIEDFLKPDRVVIGTDNDASFEKMAELYAPFVRQGNPVIRMDPVSAEITKYACNAFLATRISFMNELALLCDRVGGDVERVRRGMSTDERIGRHFLYAGVGYGGSCFPKDVQALMSKGREFGVDLGVVTAAEDANARQKKVLGERIAKYFGGNLAGKKIAIWGLAFKPNTDDMREAPALQLIEDLTALGAKVVAFDPVAMENAKKILGDRIRYAGGAMEALEGADALAVVTEWNEFRHPDFSLMRSKMKSAVIFDGRNVFDPQKMKDHGFTYTGMGRGQIAGLRR